jgi:hypothetical protein
MNHYILSVAFLHEESSLIRYVLSRQPIKVNSKPLNQYRMGNKD